MNPDEKRSEEEDEAILVAKIERRAAELESGVVEGIPWEKVQEILRLRGRDLKGL